MSKNRHIEFHHDIHTYRAEIGRGNVPGAMIHGGFGERDVATATSTDVWPGPTATQPFPVSTGIQMEVVSSDAADTNAGTGIQQVEIHYLDADGNEQTEIVVMDGLTPVNTAATDIRFVQCFHAYHTGSNNAAVGNISLRSTDGATVYSYILAGSTRCSSAARMVPKGKNMFITGAVGASSSGASKRAILRIESNAIDGDIVNSGAVFFPQGTSITQDNSTASAFDPAMSYPELSIIKATAETTGACFTSVTWFGYYENN